MVRLHGLAMVLAVALGLLLGPGARAGDEAGRWLTSLADAQKRAAAERKAVMAVFLDARPACATFERMVERDRDLGALLDELVCVKLDPSHHGELVKRYRIESFPAVLFTTPGGRPIKLVVGNTPTPKLRRETKEALEKHQRSLDPASWQPTRKRSPPPRDGPRRLHRSSCPVDCEFCAPAIERALAWLVPRQTAAGSWTKPPTERETRTDDGRILTRSIDHIDTTLTAVAGLALLAAGSAPGVGPHGARLNRARSFLTRAIRDDGSVTADGGDFIYHVHEVFETSLAAMFLAECQRLDPDPELASRLRIVAKALERAQDEKSGGWGYSFDAKEHPALDKRGWRLLATTHCSMSALNALRDAGVGVDAEVLRRGADYLLSCIGRDGAFTYRSELRFGDGYPGASAGALYAISRTGLVDATRLERPRRRLRDELTKLDGFGEHWWFMTFFAALASNDRAAGSWNAFHDAYRDVILANQQEDGSFGDPDGKAGSVFATAIAVFVLELGARRSIGGAPIFGRRSCETEMTRVDKPRYLTPPNPLSRVKVFEHEGRYLADLIVSVDGPADDAYLRHLADGLRGASRMLFDVTDGQMCLHRVTIRPGGVQADVADILVTSRFYDDPNVPRGGAHGITMVTKRDEVRGGRETEGKRIGEWVKLPFHLGAVAEPVPWHHFGLIRVMTHELCHYLLGVQDEYGPGGTYCACIIGDLQTSELCTPAGHTDDRRERSCWAQAQLLYPKLNIPDAPDPGPWDPPAPLVEILR